MTNPTQEARALLPVIQADDPDMSWFDIAVDKRGNVVVLDHAPGWADFDVEFHFEDTFDCDPPKHLAPGAYRWTGFKVGFWAEDDHINVKGGDFIPHRLAFSQVPADRESIARALFDFDVETEKRLGRQRNRRWETELPEYREHMCQKADAILSLSPKSAGDDGDMVLGRFGHHPEAAIDYECEIDALIGIAYERLTMGGHPDLEERIRKAMEFRVLQTPGELRWLNQTFNGVREIYARKPGWVQWPEDKLSELAARPSTPDTDMVRAAVIEEAAAIADRVAKECGTDLRNLKKAGDDLPGEAMARGGQIEAMRIAKLIRAVAPPSPDTQPHDGDRG